MYYIIISIKFIYLFTFVISMLSLYLLQLLHSSQVIPDIKPETIIFDMEKAAATTFTKVFGNVTVHFCYFHWRQAFWKNLSHGLS